MTKESLLATGLLAGTIIGAGIFSLPYIFSRLGLVSSFFYLIVFTAVYFVIHLMYAQVLKIQEGEHQFFYLAHKYFSEKFANLASFIILGELIFVMLVYLVLAPTFAELVFGSDGFIYLLVFWLFSSIFIFVRLSILGLADFAGIISILAIILIVFFAGGGKLVTPFFQKLDLALFFLPFGPLLFSLSGRPAIHKVIEIYRKVKGVSFSLPKVIFWGTVIPAMVYLLFVVSILRLNPEVLPETLNSLGFLPSYLLVLLGILGLITLWTSYFMIGTNVKDILYLDLKKPFWLSAFVVLFTPLLFYFLGFKNFLFVISFVGSIFLAFEGIFVIAMWQRAFPQNRWRWLSWPLYLIFLIAMVYEIFTFFRL